MFEHPYLTQQVTQFEQEEMVRAAERRRFLREHADQIVPRPAGAFRRMLRRIVGRRTDAAPSPAPLARPESAHAATEHAAAGCEPAAAR